MNYEEVRCEGVAGTVQAVMVLYLVRENHEPVRTRAGDSSSSFGLSTESVAVFHCEVLPGTS